MAIFKWPGILNPLARISNTGTVVGSVLGALSLLHGALNPVSIAVVDGSTVTYAHFGANEHTEYEIGSLTKTLYGKNGENIR